MSTPDTWDPEPHQRIYVRSTKSGDLGWLVRRDGKDVVKLDRPFQEIVVEYNVDEWPQEMDHRPIPHARLVKMAFEFDRMLLRELGDHERARKDWHQLSEEQRKAWIEKGPKNPPIRAIMYRTLMDTLKEHMR
jgi:hypothetical protein